MIRATIPALFVAVVLAGCGSDDPDPASTGPVLPAQTSATVPAAPATTSDQGVTTATRTTEAAQGSATPGAVGPGPSSKDRSGDGDAASAIAKTLKAEGLYRRLGVIGISATGNKVVLSIESKRQTFATQLCEAVVDARGSDGVPNWGRVNVNGKAGPLVVKGVGTGCLPVDIPTGGISMVKPKAGD